MIKGEDSARTYVEVEHTTVGLDEMVEVEDCASGEDTEQSSTKVFARDRDKTTRAKGKSYYM